MSIDSEITAQAIFGLRLKAVRARLGYSQEGLALASGLDRSYIGGVERGERNISLANIDRLAKTLNVSPREFFE